MPSYLTESRRKEVAASLASGCDWLLKQQMPDGGWHSVTYGGLRDGAAVTSLAVYTLGLITDKRPEKRDLSPIVEAAGKFLQEGFQKRRTIASPDGSLDYPTYAAAMVATSMRPFPGLGKALPREQLLQYILAAQATASRGFPKDSPEYGGWDLLGVDDATGISTGTNVSVTLYALEAIAREDSPAARQALQLAKDWLLRIASATGDGGFAFTADAPSHNNKAQWRDEARHRPRSYGSPTADALQGLVYCGLTADDEPIAAAVKWLVDHPAVEIVPGFEDLPAELGWRDGLRFYYAQSLARVLHLLPEGVAQDRAERLAKWLIKEQSGAGSWKNESARMREDDPLIATSLVLTALWHL